MATLRRGGWWTVIQIQQVGEHTDPISMLVSGFDQTTAGTQAYRVCMCNLDALCVRQEALC
jgi:hypothetical protein